MLNCFKSYYSDDEGYNLGPRVPVYSVIVYSVIVFFILQVMEVEAHEELLLAETVELPLHTQEGEQGLSKTQRKNRRAKQKRRQLVASVGVAGIAAAPVAVALLAATQEQATPLSALVTEAASCQPLTAAGGRPHLPRVPRRPNQARPMPKSIFDTAWREMLKAKRSLDVAMELMKFYR